LKAIWFSQRVELYETPVDEAARRLDERDIRPDLSTITLTLIFFAREHF
jgi:hypothetical protein